MANHPSRVETHNEGSNFDLSSTKAHEACNHISYPNSAYIDGGRHTNTIEGLWAPLKRAWYRHCHYSTGYTPFYVAERYYVYNYRNEDSIFWKFLTQSMGL